MHLGTPHLNLTITLIQYKKGKKTLSNLDGIAYHGKTEKRYSLKITLEIISCFIKLDIYTGVPSVLFSLSLINVGFDITVIYTQVNKNAGS